MYNLRIRTKMAFNFTAVIAILTLLAACSGVDHKLVADWTSTADIYMGGALGDSTTYWRNGEAISSGKGKEVMDATAATVSGEDIYLAGFISMKKEIWDTIKTQAAYCKNGKLIFLTDGRFAAVATGIAVSGNDVYVSGYEYDGDIDTTVLDHPRKMKAKYWKNGIPVILTGGHADFATATAIAVEGSDVFVAGYENDEFPVAKYWKNGKEIPLQISNLKGGPTSSEAFSIFVQGKDVYIAGTAYRQAVYWKNGIPVFLPRAVNPDTSEFSEPEDLKATSIVVKGRDVYVAGIQDTLASLYHTVKYWKNGKAVGLSKKPMDAKTDAFLTLHGNDVYMSCTLADPGFNYKTMVWKNNVPAVFSTSTMRATSIAVSDKYH